MRREGSTIAVRDRLERLPLPAVSLCRSRPPKWQKFIRLFSLKRRERGLRLVVLAVFVLHVTIDTGDFLRP